MELEKKTPIQRFQDDIRQGCIIVDPIQEQAVLATQVLYDHFVNESMVNSNLIYKLKQKFFNSHSQSKLGIYFWGGVGRGKTHIVDNFFESLPFKKKLRIHFHRFMQRVHGELKLLNNVENPLASVADEFAKDAKVICFDEFHVSDITDAMLLSGLLRAIFDRGIILVTTSNEHPDRLYWDGLQRSRFVPAIELIKQHTQIINVDSGVDYRLRYLDSAEIYHHPLDENAAQMLSINFENIAPNYGRANRTIEIEKRKIQTVHAADSVVWFEFSEICDGPRGTADYIEIGRQYQTVLIANVPKMNEDMNDQAKRFITLVDEFYDRNVKLILTAELEINSLYQGMRLQFEFERTRSRLIEMQSHDYLARQHLCD